MGGAFRANVPPLKVSGAWQKKGATNKLSMYSLFPSSVPLKNSCSCSGSAVLAVLEHGTSISFYNHSFELKFGTNTLWYVTPSPLQLVF